MALNNCVMSSQVTLISHLHVIFSALRKKNNVFHSHVHSFVQYILHRHILVSVFHTDNLIILVALQNQMN